MSSSGALFVITIPTEDEEKRLQQKIRVENRIENSSTTTTTATGATKSTLMKTLRNTLPRSSKTRQEKESIDSPRKILEGHHYGTFDEKSAKRSFPSHEILDNSISTTVNEKSPKDLRCKSKYNLNGNFNDIEEDEQNIKKSWEGLKDIVLSGGLRKNSMNKKRNSFDIEISEDSAMEIVLKEILKKFRIENSTWTKTNNGKSFQIIFTIEYDEKYEYLQQKLKEWGIGDREGSTISILHCVNFNTYKKPNNSDEDDNLKDVNEEKQSAWNRFMNTLTARLNVAQIIRDVRQDATITFDFVVLVVCAGILASFGLVEDSTIFLASSMLVSPLMGPIIAAIFGTVIKDRSLQMLGVINELLGISLATFVGFLFGLIVCTFDDRYGIGEGLTSEMLSRCELHSVIVGILTAIPSGAAAAVGILGGNVGSLVGVAISASLLPPAVNSGVLWALACIYLAFETDGTRYNNVVKTNFYSNHQAVELAILGSISMCVTITNVICVYVMGILVLKIKEIAPLVSNSRQFWKHDIKIAREINKNGYNEDSVLVNEIAAALPDDEREALGINPNLLKTINIERSSYQNTWSPMSTRHALTFIENQRPTVQDLERIYLTMTASHPLQDQNKYARANSTSSKGRTPQIAISDTSYPRRSTSVAYGVEPLEQIVEVHYVPDSNEITENQLNNKKTKLQEDRKKRKFTITPAADTI